MTVSEECYFCAEQVLDGVSYTICDEHQKTVKRETIASAELSEGGDVKAAIDELRRQCEAGGYK